MISCVEKDGGITVEVRVVPRSSKSEIAGEFEGALRIRIAAAPVEGAANEELVKVLARAFGLPKRNVTIRSGHSAKQKRVRIDGATHDDLNRLLD